MIRYSTGRGSRVPKSTGGEIWEFKKRSYKGIERIKFSTGENASIRHVTGTLLDEKEVKPCPLCKGRGTRPYGFKCPECNGKGVIMR